MQIRLNVLGGHGSARLMGPHEGRVSAKPATHEMEKTHGLFGAPEAWGPGPVVAISKGMRVVKLCSPTKSSSS